MRLGQRFESARRLSFFLQIPQKANSSRYKRWGIGSSSISKEDL
jgi:hypothetical protein